ncbi:MULTISPECIES: queuosine precursor transporter [Pyrobaculum]|uniref:Queuosine precursor transporter n=2 Tax=Pyrobaculum arsenaticum TaxID=121277 RepID=A0A7L4PER6_9CREN|nr:queuosine precursor transporter [Pyrobaculum arsenaticum]MCY0890017.1 queuosine precursor transporter [Pyrobaculum arsenaticum]NYR16106.1 queuosine precursor transporter [Pyrobaculum arsenaticum]
MLALFMAWLYGLVLYSVYLFLLWLWRERVETVLVGLFFGTLTAAQFIANKLVDYGVGVAPAGTVIFMTNVAVLDAMAVFYGRQFAIRAVRLGFFFQAAVAFAAWSASQLPPPAWFAERAAVVDSVIAPSARIAIASLTAYLASSTIDVYIVTRWPRLHILARVYSSSLVAQVVDTALFITLAFGPSAEVILGQIIVKWLQIPLEALLVYGARRYVGAIRAPTA